MKSIEYFYTAAQAEFRFEDNDRLCVSVSGMPTDLGEQDISLIRYILRNPGTSLDEILLYALALGHTSPDAGEMRARLGMLCEKHVLDIQTHPLRIHIPYRIEHQCEMCGCSCMAQLVGPLTPEELDNLHDAHRQLHEAGDIPPHVNPVMKGIKPDGSCMHFVHFPDKRCVFLDAHHLCAIHRKCGPMMKPAACRLFPHIAVETESELRIGIKPYCYANMRAYGDAMPPKGYAAQWEAENKVFYDALLHAATKRPVLYRATPEEAMLARLQETALLDILGNETISLNQIIRLSAGSDDLGDPSPDTPLPTRFMKTLHARFLALSGRLREDVQKLGTTVHANHVHALCRRLESPLSLTPEQADPAFLSFARLALFHAVFLRETMRFPALLPGVFALALGVLAAIQDPEHSDTLFVAWMRLMAQTSAFTYLFDSPDALTSLARTLD